jgi:hypothetical protein
LEIRLDNDDAFAEECKENVSSCIFSMLQIEQSQRPTASEMIARFLELRHVGEESIGRPQENRTNMRHLFLPLQLANRVDASAPYENISSTPEHLSAPPIASTIGTVDGTFSPFPFSNTTYRYPKEEIIPAGTLGSFVSSPSFHDDTTVNFGPPAMDLLYVPSLEDLAERRYDGQIEERAMCEAIIVKAQPQHKDSLAHLSHHQLRRYISDLVYEWRRGNKRQVPSLPTGPESWPTVQSPFSTAVPSPHASHQSSLPSTTIGTPRTFSPGPFSSPIDRVYYTITNSKIWEQEAVHSNFDDLFSALRKFPFSYILWRNIYHRIRASADFIHILMLADERLLQSNPGVMVLMANVYASKGDFKSAVDVGTKLQNLDLSILLSALQDGNGSIAKFEE